MSCTHILCTTKAKVDKIYPEASILHGDLAERHCDGKHSIHLDAGVFFIKEALAQEGKGGILVH